VLQEIVGIAANRKVQIALIGGDLFETSSPTAESENIVYRAVLDLARVCEWVVVISGNHDNPRRLEAIKPLFELTNVRVASDVRRPDEGGVITLQTKVGAARIALFPFLSQRSIVRADDLMMRDADEHAGTYAERAERIIEHLSADVPASTVNVLLVHAMVHGGVLGGGERSAHTIFEYSIPTTAFPASMHYTALGHLHRAQKLPGACPIWYSGSPLQLDFGETRDTKSVNVIVAEPSEPATVETIPLTSGRRLRRIRTTMDKLEEVVAEGSDDYLRVEIVGHASPGLADEVRRVLPNAVDVTIAPGAEDGAAEREGDRRLGRSPRELFAEYLDERREDDARVRSLFDELLDEAQGRDQASGQTHAP
jgi:exonuclease SbcD